MCPAGGRLPSDPFGWGSQRCRVAFDLLGGAADARQAGEAGPLVQSSRTGPIFLDTIMAGVVL